MPGRSRSRCSAVERPRSRAVAPSSVGRGAPSSPIGLGSGERDSAEFYSGERPLSSRTEPDRAPACRRVRRRDVVVASPLVVAHPVASARCPGGVPAGSGGDGKRSLQTVDDSDQVVAVEGQRRAGAHRALPTDRQMWRAVNGEPWRVAMGFVRARNADSVHSRSRTPQAAHTSRSRLSRHTGPTANSKRGTAWWTPGPSLT